MAGMEGMAEMVGTKRRIDQSGYGMLSRRRAICTFILLNPTPTLVTYRRLNMRVNNERIEIQHEYIIS